MLPAGTRLNRQQFTLLSSNPRLTTVFNRLGTGKYLSSSTKPQYSVVTSSKHEKRAVVRNRVRRRIYTLLRTLHFSCIIYVSKHAYTMTYEEISSLYQDLVRKMQKNTQ